MLHGWCEICHKFKQVRVRRPNPTGVQMGVCSNCEEKRK